MLFRSFKNHIYLLDALKLLHASGFLLHAVFTGNDFGIQSYLTAQGEKYELSEYIHWGGFVTERLLRALYRCALAMTMPTYYGSTNIPPLEAFFMRCPVCYSDLPGLREQVEDAAFLLDLNTPCSLVDAILKIKHEDPIVEEKKLKGIRLLEKYSSEIPYWEVLDSIFSSFKNKMRTWCEV